MIEEAIIIDENEVETVWTKSKLGNICEVATGKWDANHAVLNGKYRFYTCAYDYLQCDTKRFSGECLILPGNGANVGEVFYYKGEFDAYQRTYVIQNIRIVPKFLYYHLKLNWKKGTDAKQYGSATNYIRIGNFNDYEISYPSLIEQQQIVSKIEELFSELDKGIEELKTAQQQLKVYRQAVLKWAFEGKLTEQWRKTCESLVLVQSGSKGSELPEGWKCSHLGGIIESPKYGTSKKCDYKKVGKGVLRIPNIQGGTVDDSDLKYAEFDEDEIATYSLKEGDLLIIRSNGSVDIVGKCALITKQSTDYLYAGYLIRLRPIQSEVNPRYLLHAFSSSDLRNQIKSKAKSTSGVNNINSDELKSLIVPICSIEEQLQIIQEIESRLSVCDKIEETITDSLKQAEALRQSILKKAFKGELL